ncbi:uncharacterized protein LOC18039761 [Citrus clementina]|uniref:uncharacterized protein LOC18039761 n=1 Tax=Citrus clementina TaxID=85681 RepID=UPI000CED6E70|nr:uncharacterized protein LOC18039761 [Citrus x clementina]
MEPMKEEASFRHFSHHHPLVLTPNSPPAAQNVACNGCNLSINTGKDYYHCKICNFSLHKVCYNMPIKTRHPGHPSHFLNLLVMPSSVKGSFKCRACSQNVTGFYYNCGQCGFYYHILCSALPLSTSVKSHSHPLELEFSLPYDFECDFCKKACYSGWLYRCHICEFDAHLACAIVNQMTQSLQHQPISDPLTRQIIYSPASLMESSKKIIDYGSESNELMQLVAQGIARGINQEIVNVAIVTGWDEKLCSRSEKLKIKNGMIEFSGKIQTKQDMEHPNQESSAFNRREANVVQDVEQKTSYRNDSVLDRIAENLEPAAAKEELRKPSFGFHYGPEYKINEAFLKEAGIDANENRNNNKMKKKNEPKDRSSIKNQSPISDTERSCWWKLLQSCCYYPKYERETIFP